MWYCGWSIWPAIWIFRVFEIISVVVVSIIVQFTSLSFVAATNEMSAAVTIIVVVVSAGFP